MFVMGIIRDEIENKKLGFSLICSFFQERWVYPTLVATNNNVYLVLLS